MKYPRVPIGMMLNHFFTRPRFPVKDGRDDATHWQGQDATDEVDGFMLARRHEPARVHDEKGKRNEEDVQVAVPTGREQRIERLSSLHVVEINNVSAGPSHGKNETYLRWTRCPKARSGTQWNEICDREMVPTRSI